MEQIESYTIDLSKINGSGEFRCPRCGVEISPDDKTEDIYTILQPVMKRDSVEKIILQCNKCRSQINLIGFHILKRIR